MTPIVFGWLSARRNEALEGIDLQYRKGAYEHAIGRTTRNYVNMNDMLARLEAQSFF